MIIKKLYDHFCIFKDSMKMRPFIKEFSSYNMMILNIFNEVKTNDGHFWM